MNCVGSSFDELFLGRMAESYLAGKFLHKKRRKEEQVLNLSCLLAGKTKKESTIMFYEILVFLFGISQRDCFSINLYLLTLQ